MDKERQLYEFRNAFPDCEVRFSESDIYEGKLDRVYVKKGDIEKSFFYNNELETIVSNFVDAAYRVTLPYGHIYTFHSYHVGNKARAFLAITNIDYGIVLPVAYDLIKKEFIILPINDKNIIDDDAVKLTIENEPEVGMEIESYRKINFINMFFALKDLKIEKPFDVTHELLRQNEDRVNELADESLRRIRIKRNK